MKKVFVFITIISLLCFGISIVFSHNMEPQKVVTDFGGPFGQVTIIDSDTHDPLEASGSIHTMYVGTMYWYAGGSVGCQDHTYKSVYYIDTSIYRSGVGIVDEDYSDRDIPSDYTRYGIFSESNSSSWDTILPVGVSSDPDDYIDECYSYTYVSGAPFDMLIDPDVQSSPSEGGSTATTMVPEYW